MTRRGRRRRAKRTLPAGMSEAEGVIDPGPMPPLPTPGAGEEAFRAAVREQKAWQARAEFLRAAGVGSGDGGRDRETDLGHGLAIRRGQVEVNRDALISADPSDKTSPTVRGSQARRVWAPDRLLANKTISQEQHNAAARLLADYEVGVEGADPNRRSVPGARTPPWDRLPASQKRLAALASWRAAQKALPMDMHGIVGWCVLRHIPPDAKPTVEAWAVEKGWPTHRAVGFLTGALVVLATHYGFREGKVRHTIAGDPRRGPPPPEPTEDEPRR